MRVPLSWLQEYLTIHLSPEELAEHLIRIGIEVEKIENHTALFSGVKVAKVTKISPHPQADKLQLATVDDGTETYNVVCGAPNCREGLLTAFAPEGASLSHEGKSYTIKSTKIRGIPSYGMLCSEEELGIGTDADGIIELTEEWTIGEELAPRISDIVLELSITPNLAHCLSIEGVARELAALLSLSLKQPHHAPILPEKQHSWHVSLQTREDCPSYAALIMQIPPFQQAPLLMRMRLQHAGIRPINAIVDCANYVMLSIGQPLHTFDAAAFPNKKIIVQHATGKETILLLDGRSISIPENTLIISNDRIPCAIAGVMGDEASGVSSTTQTIVVESAFFNPPAIRRSGKNTLSSSESLRRFERGIDPNTYQRGISLFWALFSHMYPQSSILETLYEGRENVELKKIECRRSKTTAILGRAVNQQEMESTFSRLGYPAHWLDADTLSVAVPAFRHDVHEEIDLIEDIGKLNGFLAAEPEQKRKTAVTTHPDHPLVTCEETVRRILTALNLQECITCDLINPQIVDIMTDQPIPQHAIISIENPTSQELSILRPSLFFGLIDSLQRNIAHGQRSFHAFEIGTSHLKNEGKFLERLVAGVMLSGQRTPHHFSQESESVDFFDLKGLLESFMEAISLTEYMVLPSAISLFHNKRQAAIMYGNHQIGMLGEIHPGVLERFSIQQRVYFMELDIQDIWTNRHKQSTMQPLATYPATDRDWTIVIPKSLNYREVIETIQGFCPSIVESVSLKNIFENPQTEETKNMCLRFIFRDPSRTLTEQEVHEAFTTIVQKTSQALGVSAFAGEIGQKNS